MTNAYAPPPAPGHRSWEGAPPPLGFPEPGPISRAVRLFWDDEAYRPASLRSVAVGLTAGVVVAVVLVGHAPGLGVPVALAAVWLPAMPALMRRRAWSVLVTAACGLALASMVAVRDAGWVVGLCLVGALAVSAVAAVQARSVLGVALAVPTAPLAAVRELRSVTHTLRSGLAGRRLDVARVARTGAVTLVLLVVFGWLLASADAVFASLLPRWDLSLLPAQVLIGALGATVALAVVGLVAAPPAWSTATGDRVAAWKRADWFVPVLALNAVMTAFLLTQLVAAVGGDDYVRATTGLTYAAYARAGFGQLVTVTALTLGVIAWFALRVPEGGRRQVWAARGALAVLTLAALGVVATALVRMSLYVAAYGLTELRVLATAGEIGMGLVLLMVLVAVIRWRAAWLPLAVVRAAAVVVIALAVVNPEGLMVRFNTQAQDAPLDVVHLGSLSADAVPAIDALPEPLRSCLLSRHEHVADPSVWGWNSSRAAVVMLDDVVEQPDCRPVI